MTLLLLLEALNQVFDHGPNLTKIVIHILQGNTDHQSKRKDERERERGGKIRYKVRKTRVIRERERERVIMSE